MRSQAVMVTVPNVTITLDQLLGTIRQLDSSARIRIAQVLLETDLDSQFSALIHRLAERVPADEISDDIINAEISAVRQKRAQDSYAKNRN